MPIERACDVWGRTGVALLDDGTVSHDIAHIGQKDSRERE